MVPKLLLLAFILLVAWYGVRFVTRVGQMRQAMRRATEQAAMNAQARGQGARPARSCRRKAPRAAVAPIVRTRLRLGRRAPPCVAGGASISCTATLVC